LAVTNQAAFGGIRARRLFVQAQRLYYSHLTQALGRPARRSNQSHFAGRMPRDARFTRISTGYSASPCQKSAFFQCFLRFFLAFYFYLGYSAQRPEFFRS
jgi:hypothetical protein